MEIFLDFLVAVFAAFGILSTLWHLGWAVNAPVRRGDRLTAVILARGDAELLGQDVNALRRLRRHGYRDMRIVVVDDGMDPGASELAGRLAETGDVFLWGTWEIFKK